MKKKKVLKFKNQISSQMTNPIQISIVIPVYQGEKTLPKLVGELIAYSQVQMTKLGNPYVINDIILVHDCGFDRSDKVIALSINPTRAQNKKLRSFFLSSFIKSMKRL